MEYPVRTIIIAPGADDRRDVDTMVRRFNERFPGLHIIRENESHSRRAPRTGVRLLRHPGSFIKEFPNHPWYGNTGCDYSLILGFNCFCSCAYCFIQTIFDDRTPTLYVNTGDIVSELDSFLRNNPTAWISTGEYLDSFQLDDVTRTNEVLIDVFRRYPKSTLELRTKIDNVAHLPDHPPGNVLVTYSINPPEVIKGVEPGTASFEKRLEMAGALRLKGYRVALRIDPIIPTESYVTGYQELPVLIQNQLGWDKVDRVFAGVLRFDETLLTRMSAMPRAPLLLDAEYIRCPDGNYRPLKHERIALFRSVTRAIRGHAPQMPISISMEPPYVREAVLGDR